MQYTYMFKFSPQVLEVAKLQVTQLKNPKSVDYYESISKGEFDAYSSFIDLTKAKTVLELGCGLGRGSIYLHNQFPDNQCRFILADFDEIKEGDLKFGWNPGDVKYNKLALTENFCQEHGMKNFEVFDLGSRKISELHDIDLVLSFLSVGFHYPIEEYLKDLISITSEHAVMIFGVRKGIYNQNSFSNLFSYVFFIDISGINTKEQMMILVK